MTGPALKLMVTGSSGFADGYVPREAARRYETVALARSQAAGAVTPLGAHPVSGDLKDARSLVDGFTAAKSDGLVSLASLGFGHASMIVGSAERAGIKRAVFVRTTAVTTSPPVCSKRARLAAEQSIRESVLDWTILRPTMINGDSGDRNLSRPLLLLRRASVLPLPGRNHFQRLVDVGDVADALLAAAKRPAAAGRSDDVARPEPLTFTKLLQTAARAVASRTRFVPVPLSPVLAAARGYELLSRSPRIRAEHARRLAEDHARRLAEDKAFAIDDAVRDLDYAPNSFAEGIRAEARAMGLVA
jgi:uncharacterized protein YbjT (DUF2867 family)